LPRRLEIACPVCQSPAKVIETRPTGVNAVYRRKECEKGHRFSTYEKVETEDFSKDVELATAANARAINALANRLHNLELSVDSLHSERAALAVEKQKLGFPNLT